MSIKALITIIYTAFALIIVITIKASLYQSKENNEYAHIIIQQEPDNLNPLFSSMSASSEIQRTIFTPMVEIKPDGKPLPLLVSKIPTKENKLLKILDDNKVKVKWIFKENLVWEDGKKLGPDDVIFTWKVIMNEKVWVRNRNFERRIHSMYKDPKETNSLIVIWKKPYAFYYKGHTILPKHKLQKEYSKTPERLHLSRYNKKPIGNGPFKIKEWKIGNYILLTKNKNYYKTNTKLNGIYYQFIGNTNSMILATLSGNADAISPVGLSFDQAIDFKKKYKQNFNTHIKDGIVWEHIDFNLDNQILKNENIRKAIIYAINRKQMIKYLFNNKLKIAHSWLPPLHPGYYSNIHKYPYNKEKAIQLLKQEGFQYLNENNIRMNKDKKELSLTLITTAGNKIRERIQIAIKQDLKKIGINLKINNNQNAITLFGETIPKRQFDMAMYAWIFSPLSHGEEMWSSDAIPNEENNYIGDNIPGYKNEYIDMIHKNIPNTINQKKRIELFKKQQEIWTKELPSLPLYFRAEVSITKKNFQNWKPTGTDTPITWNAENWNMCSDATLD